jgi:aldehyde dehydrogenase (NAD+)/betaine-aldehyde dehydrogenase
VELANTTVFGLNANVWGATTEAMDVASRIRSGTVTINGGGGMRPDVPWGGFGLSGVGREGGEGGFLEYLETKHVQWPLDGLPTKPFGTR